MYLPRRFEKRKKECYLYVFYMIGQSGIQKWTFWSTLYLKHLQE